MTELLAKQEQKEQRFQKNMQILEVTDRREGFKCSRIDQLARKQLAANIDYYMPEELKSHVVEKFFECYDIEAKK